MFWIICLYEIKHTIHLLSRTPKIWHFGCEAQKGPCSCKHVNIVHHAAKILYGWWSDPPSHAPSGTSQSTSRTGQRRDPGHDDSRSQGSGQDCWPAHSGQNLPMWMFQSVSTCTCNMEFGDVHNMLNAKYCEVVSLTEAVTRKVCALRLGAPTQGFTATTTTLAVPIWMLSSHLDEAEGSENKPSHVKGEDPWSHSDSKGSYVAATFQYLWRRQFWKSRRSMMLVLQAFTLFITSWSSRYKERNVHPLMKLVCNNVYTWTNQSLKKTVRLGFLYCWATWNNPNQIWTFGFNIARNSHDSSILSDQASVFQQLEPFFPQWSISRSRNSSYWIVGRIAPGSFQLCGEFASSGEPSEPCGSPDR